MSRRCLDSFLYRTEGRGEPFKAVLETSAGVCRGSLGVTQREDLADEAVCLGG